LSAQKKPRTGAARGKAAESTRHEKMLQVLRQFRVVVKSIRTHYRQVEQQAGVSGAQLWALAHVGEHPGSTVGDLARALAIHPSTTSNLIRKLETSGLLARQRAGADLRSVQLFLTETGDKVLSQAPQPLIGVLQQALSELPDATLAALHEGLHELIGAMAVKDLRAGTIPISHME
jgi:DNA-binding MarR family transcriptional regulator